MSITKFQTLDEVKNALRNPDSLEQWLEELIATNADIAFEPHSIYYCPIGKFINQNHEFSIFEVGRGVISVDADCIDDVEWCFLPEWLDLYVRELDQLPPDIPINSRKAYDVLENVLGQMMINDFLTS